MKQFFKFMFASMLGTILVFALMTFFFFMVMVISIASIGAEKVSTVSPGTVLKLTFDYTIPERTVFDPMGNFPFSVSLREKPGLNEIVQSLRKARYDGNIKGIYLSLDNVIIGGTASLEAIRRELLEFKKSGKFIIAYGASVSQRGYYLGSVADKIYIAPLGSLDFKGLSVEYTFFKNTLNKLDIEPQIFQYGKYKSAVEPFKLDKMSEENRRQTSELIVSVYDHILRNIEKERDIPYAELDKIADGALVRTPEDALRLNLIDALKYEDEVIGELKGKAGSTASGRLRTVSLEDYVHVKSEENYSAANKIAVVYAVGEIQNGKGNDETIGSDNIVRAIRAARENKNVKAVVMRINSPGGDALVSDLIWREVTLTRSKKPFIVSMGNVAASGGYYIACAADRIVAEPNTITGSIGVFGLIPNMQGFFNNKLGITFDRVNTGRHSDYITTTRPLNAEEKAIIQGEIDRIYKAFVTKVSDGRNKSFDQIHEIAQGRVWTGLQAKQNGLVDTLGGLNTAVSIAAAKAGVKNYSIIEYPKPKGPFETFFENISSEAQSRYLEYKLGEYYRYYKTVEQLSDIQGIKTRLPFDIYLY